MSADNELEQQSLPLLSKVNGEALLKTTPMFQQFLEIKSDNLDSLLFLEWEIFMNCFLRTL